ncbi:RteC domain-containing protein [Maribacter ulvicola]|uniref:RteC protein n=1 Tax=Maribacter ulvicola TaxID=228959 RepID=A0A1N6QU63_9FLAO|nr:RteC domain-containing protein [Maribacter ulvicola]SIQ20115.1 RteC protein [Maribacter ulvicola]
MYDFYENIIRNLEDALETLESENEDIIYIAVQGIKLSKQALNKFRNKVLEDGFNSRTEEISFFKSVKPQVYSKLIYYATLFNLESRRPRGSYKSQIKYFYKYIDKLDSYFNENLEFYHYYRRGASMFDEYYFLRGKEDIHLFLNTYHFYADEQFSTSHDSTVATILAYDLLIIHLKKEIDKLEGNGNQNRVNQSQVSIAWTGHKIDLIELIYALYSSDAINNGNAEIKDIARIVERIFKINLGNYYHKFIEIKSRKINQTKYIDKLKESLLNYIEKSDE